MPTYVIFTDNWSVVDRTDADNADEAAKKMGLNRSERMFVEVHHKNLWDKLTDEGRLPV